MLSQKSLEKIGNLNVEQFEVENVRSILQSTTVLAKLYCEMAVVDGAFKKFYGVKCKNSECNKIISFHTTKEDIPEKVICDICEMEDREHVFNKKDLQVLTFYKLNQN